MARENDFLSAKKYAALMMEKERRLHSAIQALRDAHLNLSLADSYTFDREIKVLQEMEQRLYKTDLFLCAAGTRTVGKKHG